MANVIVVIDMQNDFVTGALGTPEAKVAVHRVRKLLDAVKGNPEYKILFTRDTHFANYKQTREGEKLPVPHCLIGTDGWSIVPELEKFVIDNKNARNVYDKYTFGSERICKEIFYYTRYDNNDKVFFVGVCTDICVLSNVLIFTAKYPNVDVVVFEDCCAGTTTEKHNEAIDVMQSCLVTVCKSGVED